uniref:EF-hand domain-containing protein n=1 Tax=Phytophthora ramorum TaxID=164328 RepID=H3GR44_PHYRM
MASGSKTASGDKKKAKKSSRSSAEASSRNKDRKSKDKKSSSKKEKPTVTTELAPPSPVPTPPLVHDPDAIQLFRRYDRNRSGVLTRLDFLQLLKDYADPASGWRYQRADRNSEFEAGQLFERYDKDHTGALNLDRFHVFFADFKPQLRAFVEESNYRSLAPPAETVTPAPLLPVQEEEPVAPTTTVQDAASGADDAVPSPKTMRAQYRAALWKLRRIYKDELIDQRDSIAQQMKTIRENIASRQRESNRSSSVVRWGDSRRSKQSLYPEFDNDDFHDESGGGGITETKQYEAMEDDLDRLDELMRYVRRYLSKACYGYANVYEGKGE